MKELINSKKNKIKELGKAGFTLIELLVVLAIFSLIMGIALFNQAGLSSNILITNLAYETALAVREAQAYGISVRATASSTATVSFDKGYGAYFDIDKPLQFVVFGDSDNNNTYTLGAVPSELQSLYEIRNQRGNKIVAICVGNGSLRDSGITPCVDGTRYPNSVKKLSIMFKRPNPESIFLKDVDGDGNFIPATGAPAVIVVNNIDNSNCRAIIVEITGQIRVENESGGNCKNNPK